MSDHPTTPPATIPTTDSVTGPANPADPGDPAAGSAASGNVDATALLAFWAEHRTQMRQSENQRATLTNYTLVVAAALAGLMAQLEFASRTWPLAAFVTATGVYGAVTVAKYHERANYHLHQARTLTRHLVATGALPDLTEDLTRSRADHRQRFPVLTLLRLHSLWTALHVGITVFGLVLLTLALHS